MCYVCVRVECMFVCLGFALFYCFVLFCFVGLVLHVTVLLEDSFQGTGICGNVAASSY